MAQLQKTKQTSKTTTEEPEAEEAKDIQNPELGLLTDDILDAIDEAIGELGEEFALTFVQQGGE